MLKKSTKMEALIKNALPVLNVFRHALHRPLRLTDIEKYIGLSHQTTFRKVKILEENKILVRTGNVYELNFGSELVFKLLELLATKEREDLFMKYKKLREPFEYIINTGSKTHGLRYVVLFGSYATGRATEHSDIDVFIVIDEEEYKRVKDKFENLLRTIEGTYFFEKYGFSPVYATPKDVKNMVDERKKFIQAIIEEGVLIYREHNFYNDISALMKDWTVWK